MALGRNTRAALLLSLVPHLNPAPVPGLFWLAPIPRFGKPVGMANATDDEICSILTDTRVIALVGFSANTVRPSHGVAQFLVAKGYRVIPVNPGLAGQVFEGEQIRASLADCPPEVDLVDIFRRSEQVAEVVASAITHLPNLRTIWMQLGVHDPAAVDAAQTKGLRVVWNKCPKIEYARLLG